jgi:hypothetical protein
MNVSIKDIIAYEEQKKKQNKQELEQQREYAQVAYEEIKPEIERDKDQESQNSCRMIITSL